jgi:hypothetical protein
VDLRRRALTVAAVAVVVLVALTYLWPRLYRLAMREEAATLTIGLCLNSLHWQDPVTGEDWWAGNWPKVGDDLETAPRTLDGQDNVVSTAAGVVQFHDPEHATFVSARGGTLPLQRPPADGAYTAHCADGPPVPHAPDPWRDGWDTGVAVRLVQPGATPGAAPVLVPATVRAERDGAEVIAADAPRGELGLTLPRGRYTFTADAPDAICDPVTLDIDTEAQARFSCRPR